MLLVLAVALVVWGLWDLVHGLLHLVVAGLRLVFLVVPITLNWLLRR